MIPTDTNPRLVAIEALLDAEHELVMLGNLADLENLAEDKERLIEDLGSVDADPQTMLRIRDKAQRNDRLLSAVRAGYRSALDRINALATGGVPLKFYDRGGRTTQIRSPGKTDLEHKA